MVGARFENSLGEEVVFIGISAENVRRMKAGDPMYFDGDRCGVSGVKICIVYGETEAEIAERYFPNAVPGQPLPPSTKEH